MAWNEGCLREGVLGRYDTPKFRKLLHERGASYGLLTEMSLSQAVDLLYEKCFER